MSVKRLGEVMYFPSNDDKKLKENYRTLYSLFSQHKSD